MPVPNFIIIGAPRSGTTSLAEYLRQHPEVFMSDIKEPHFFAFKDEKIDFQGPRDQETIKKYVVSKWDNYKGLFQGAEDAQAIGEASAMYMYSKKAAQRIKKYLPDVKLIAILRNPIDRAYSHYLRMRRMHREPIDDFETALEEENRRIDENWAWPWHYIQMGYYHKQLKRYFEIFESDQTQIYIFEEFKNDTTSIVQDIYDFIGVNPNFNPSTGKYNISGVPKVNWLHQLLEKKYRFKEALKEVVPYGVRREVKRHLQKVLLEKPKLSRHMRLRMYKLYTSEIRSLENMLSIDLSHRKEA